MPTTPSELAILRARAAHLAQRIEPEVVASTDVLVFMLAGERYAVPAATLREVVMLTQRVPLPGATVPVVGLTLWRGALLRLVDIRAMLGLPMTSLNDLARVLVMESATSTIGLLVDEVLEMRAIDVSQLEEPARGTVRHTDLIVGVTKDVVAVLSAERLLDLDP
ncbi:MAG TPA: chemotaxis protein CheW [Gemmatimonas aurantiaca]|nr:chemotaxis protein CheW [Gemmatimonas aurantiaca]HCT56290.1 chemotaxis protein CheW [Gemmatimonas aurantiaca]